MQIKPLTLRAITEAISPAMGHTALIEAVRAGGGAALGLAFIIWTLLSPEVDLRTGLFIVAPLGATSVLVFCLPNSPLAQPWSVVVGNSVAAFVGVAVLELMPHSALAVGVAVGLAILAMMALRAMHPPGGAIAMMAVLNPDLIDSLGFWFVLEPVALGSVVLVLLGVVFNRLTGRVYPFRHPVAAGQDVPASHRMGLTPQDLSEILTEYRQSANLGVEDLSRLIAAAEQLAASRKSGSLTCQDIMSRNLVSVLPEARLSLVADLFRDRNFTSLPVIDAEGRYLGMIFQIHLIRRAREDALKTRGTLLGSMKKLVDKGSDNKARAQFIMDPDVPQVAPDTLMADVMPLLAEGGAEAVPVMDQGRILGIVTQTDLVSALVHAAAVGETPTPAPEMLQD